MVGFYTTCFIEAPSLEEVEEEVIKTVSRDERLKLPVDSVRSSDARIIVEEAVQVEEADVPSRPEGIVRYLMDAH